MADQTSTTHFYLSITQLAYSESQLAIQPRPPFSVGNRTLLIQQATDMANCAARFRLKDAAQIDQLALFAAQGLLDTAQTMFNMINNQVVNGLSTQDVFSAVAAALHATDAL